MKRVINGTSEEISAAVVEKVTEWDSNVEWVQRGKKGMKTQVQPVGLEELLKKGTVTAVGRLLGPQTHGRDAGRAFTSEGHLISKPSSPLPQPLFAQLYNTINCKLGEKFSEKK